MTESLLTQRSFSPWKQGLCWLMLLGPLFFLSYGQVNTFTATRDDVESLVFGWERSIPFVPWTIVPYWSIDLLYGISLFICTSRQELMRHGYRLLAASLVACAAFLLFPLKFTFTRPETQGAFGWLFRQLEQFDLPYNQAPSLHIILTWLLWLRFRQHLNSNARIVAASWFLLIAASVLTTWQHHFIDVISGIVVAVIISYLIPIKGEWRVQRPTLHARRLASKYCLGGMLFLMAGAAIPCGYLLLWPAMALLTVAAGYAGLGVTVFQKSSCGDLSLSARLLLLPYLIGARISHRWFSRHTAQSNEITAGVSLGRFPGQAQQDFAVFDLTAELHKGNRNAQRWQAYPLMDLLVPDIEHLCTAVRQLQQLHRESDKVLVCCALGLSRSATVVAAWLLAEGYAASVVQAVEIIHSQRPQIVLTPAHIATLEAFSKEQLCQTSL